MKLYNGDNIPFHSCSWFKEREPLIWAAKNAPERAHRLTWLSEGSLSYHMSRFGTERPPVLREIELYREFIERLNTIKTSKVCKEPPKTKRQGRP